MFKSSFACSEVKEVKEVITPPRSLEVIANSLFSCILSHKAFVLTP